MYLNLRAMRTNLFHYSGIIFIAALMLLASGGMKVAQANSTIQCHCFQERMFDTKKPGAADAYYLATTHNAFYAQAGGASKKIIVRARQRGLHEEDLWLAFALSQNYTNELEQLLTTRLQHTSWDDTLKVVGIEADTLSLELKRALQGEPSNITEETLLQALVQHNLADTVQLQELLELNASAKEFLASILLQQYGKQSASEYLRLVRSGAHWDWLMHEAGIDIAQVEQLWAYALGLKT
ncbi:MAG: hypothetical protein WCS16_07000 [Desulfuromonas sp.]